MGAIHVDARRAGYRGSLPDEDLDSLEPASRGRWWSRTLERGGGEGRCPTPDGPATALVAEEAGGILGLCVLGPSRLRAQGGVGEIWTLNVAPDARGRGIGTLLLEAATEELRARGCREAVVWAVEGNRQGRRFYERAGWHPDGAEMVDDRRGFPIREVRYRRAL
jgi:GNAT superfamily N-acetyltransferase